ncbi:hypothetical protein [Laspinema olomoucense]|uniref:Uncharacterized protein n=1 Tax=Laspinema olomoucense D3b TaxID=2953688 RepID=A0ABT2N2Y8_9CYAN|nr:MULTISPECIES: hypothetical protein [unclassified Laspinema]MCT7974153.1 hypothetical protein [Laspinema sp. D3d]MCT7977044.1 hypothetical protein [Laspinema sp. D3b]MCT7987461.1 hypothetical protein [Laspinema sp. D3a]
MPAPTLNLEDNLTDLFAQAWFSGKLSAIEQHTLEIALLNNALSRDDALLVHRLFYAVRRGWLKVCA